MHEMSALENLLTQVESVLDAHSNKPSHLELEIHGAVQGIGFRPFVYRLANELRLTGWVKNSTQGLRIAIEGTQDRLETFLARIKEEKPPRALIQNIQSSSQKVAGYTHFEIRPSDTSGEKSALVMPDLATCQDCIQEIFDPANRRHRYPFTNCTNCGPRFTILEALPYDRVNTTMKKFKMCPLCQAEYDDPQNRRFHAEPNACPVCGPALAFWNSEGKVLAGKDAALQEAAHAIAGGKIVALKGLGGFHLLVDARNEEAVLLLRKRKHREDKPFAVMFPSIEMVREYAEVSSLEEKLLTSPEAPIVLLHKRVKAPSLAASLAPGNPYLGILLPYTPIHYLLMKELGFPVVATSGNLSEEPICTDELEAIKHLQGIADFFLVHDRPIIRHADDSIVRVMGGRDCLLRRARGYAPLPVSMSHSIDPLLAVGAHQKNAIAVSAGADIFISQHIGDLETPESFEAFRKTIHDFQSFYEVNPIGIAADVHPDYLSTKYAGQSSLPIIIIQHHIAHVSSCMAEHHLKGPLLGVAWDGTGYGLDGTIWGGEFFHLTNHDFARRAHLRTFQLPGGEKAIQEPRRSGLGLLYEIFGEELWNKTIPVFKAFPDSELKIIRTILEKKIHAPVTSSAGRLFDAVSSLAGLVQKSRFDGQAAMALEFAMDGIDTDESYDFALEGEIVDWEPMICAILKDVGDKYPAGIISAKFHNTLAEIIVRVAKSTGEKQVVLSGGCFQNKYLTEESIRRLKAEGFIPYWHRHVPPNDGGIALGQMLVAGKGVNHVSWSSGTNYDHH